MALSFCDVRLSENGHPDNMALGKFFSFRRKRCSLPPALALPLSLEMERPGRPFRIGVFSHIYYPELIAELTVFGAHLGTQAEYHFTTDTAEKAELIKSSGLYAPACRTSIQVAPNRGRDIAPRLSSLRQHGQDLDIVLMIHTKTSPHDHRLSDWRHFLLLHLLGSAQIVQDILLLFHLAPDLGMVAARHHETLQPGIGWGQNEAWARELALRMGINLRLDAPIDFPSGSMFWARPAALRPLLQAGFDTEDFEEESGQLDGTLAHAFERMFYLSCEQSGFSWLNIALPALFENRDNIHTARSVEDIRRLLRHDLLQKCTGEQGRTDETRSK